MFSLTIKELIARKMRFLSTALAVLLGVTLMAGTLVLTDTLNATFDGVLADAHAGVDAMVRNPSAIDLSYGMVGPRMPADVIDAVRQVDGVDQAALEITGYAQVVGRDGNAVGDQAQAPAYGFNWIDVPDLNPYRLVEGHAPAADTDIVIDRGSATKTDLHVGDVATVLTQQAPAEFTISGIATSAPLTRRPERPLCCSPTPPRSATWRAPAWSTVSSCTPPTESAKPDSSTDSTMSCPASRSSPAQKSSQPTRLRSVRRSRRTRYSC